MAPSVNPPEHTTNTGSTTDDPLTILTTKMDQMLLTLDALVTEKTSALSKKISTTNNATDPVIDWMKIASFPELLASAPMFEVEKRVTISVIICKPCHLFMTSVDAMNYHKRYKRNDSFAFGPQTSFVRG